MIFGKKPSFKEAYLDYIDNIVLQEFYKGNAIYCNIMQGVFEFPKEKELQTKVAAAYEELLSHMSSKELIRLSEEARNFFYDERGRYWYEIDWKRVALSRRKLSHLTDSQYSAVLKMGTFMSDGYYRQQCVERLNGFDGTLPYFILRLNDWVIQVRECAFFMTQNRLRECAIDEIFRSLPMLEKVKSSGRRSDEHISRIEERIKENLNRVFSDISENTLSEIHSYEINVKNAIYRVVSQNKMLERTAMERLLLFEKTSYGKTLLIKGIFGHYGYEPLPINQYLKSKSAIVRYYALMFRYEKEHQAWDGLEEMLLDKSERIRGYASYILEKHTGIRVLDFYLNRLTAQVSKVVLWGIGEHGSKEEVGVIVPFLESSEEQIVAAALEAYGRLAGESGNSVYWRFLNDSRLSVSGKAYRLIKKYRICYGASHLYDAFLQNRKTMIGKYFFELLLREPSWERMPYLLLLYGDKELSDAGRNLIMAGIKRRYVYARISVQQGQEILNILERKRDQIPEEIVKEINFDLKHVVIRK